MHQGFVTPGEDLVIEPVASLMRRHESDRGVSVFGIVPVDKPRYPCTGRLDRFEGLRVSDAPFDRTEQALAERVVVADTGTRERRDDSELVKQRWECSALRRTTVILVYIDSIEVTIQLSPRQML